MATFQKGTVVISVDDGRLDAYRLFKEILEPLGLPATFNIVTDWVSDTDERPRGSISRNELAAMAASPLVEIAGHGHTHRNEDEDILHGGAQLRRWLGTTEPLGFASPGSRMKADFIEENAQKLMDMGYLYVRSVDVAADQTARHAQMLEKAKANGCDDYVLEMIPRMAQGYDSMFVNSAVIFSGTEVKDVKRLTEIAMEERMCLVCMFHSVKQPGEPGYEDMYSYDFDKCKQLATYWSHLRDEGKLDVRTNKDAYLTGCI